MTNVERPPPGEAKWSPKPIVPFDYATGRSWCRSGFLSFYHLDYTAIDYAAENNLIKRRRNTEISSHRRLYNITGYIHSQKPIVIMNGNREVAYWYPMLAGGILASSEMRNAMVDGDGGRMTRYEATGHLR